MLSNNVNIGINATDKTGRAIASAKRNLGSLSKTSAGLARSMAGMFGATIGVAVFTRMARSAIEYGSSLTDAAQATDTHVEALQALRFAAQEAGASQQQLDNSLIRVAKSTYDAQRGLSTARDAFALLNINVDEFAKLPTERKLEALARGMENATDKGKANGAAMDILGTRNAPKLMEVMKKLGIDGFDSVAQKAENAGQVMASIDAERLDRAADALARINTKLIIGTGEAVAYWEAVFNGENPYTGESDSAINKRIDKQTAAMKAALVAQENLDKARRDGALPQTLELLQMEVDFRKQVAREQEKQLKLDQEQAAAATEKAVAFEAEAAAMVAHIGKLNKFNALDKEGYELKQLEDSIAGGDNGKSEWEEWRDSGLSAQQMMVHAAQNASDSMTDSFMDFIDTGKMNFKDFASSILSDMARMSFQQGVANPLMMGLGDIFSGFGGGKATGGPVVGGTTYLVGEKGPELFTPGRSGGITPNHALGGGGSANVTFTVSTLDAADFASQMAKHRGLMVGVVSDAMNKRGKEGL